jgi:hypothetical protein
MIVWLFFFDLTEEASMGVRNENAKLLLKEARKMIRAGWCKGIARRVSVSGLTTHRCASAALDDATGALTMSAKDRDMAAVKLRRAIGRLKNGRLPNIIGWNDATGRKKTHVVTAFSEAINA